MSLKGKIALIAGGGSGIGAATAARFVRDGARVVIGDVDQAGSRAVAAGLPEGAVKVCSGDITKPEDVDRMVETALDFGDGLDILVNSAAIDPPERGLEGRAALDSWQRILEVDLTGAYLLMRAALPHLVARGGGAVINIASLSAIRYMPGKTSYSAAKGGLVSLTQQAAVAYGQDKVRCNVICPGPVRTPLFVENTRPAAEMLGKTSEELFDRFVSLSPMRRMGEPEEIAAICAFLASDDASLVTGNVIVADGGAHLVDVNGAAMRLAFEQHPPEKS
jgi:meso-butanediol dehydrogenase/(S,S)-butanediol dehydrogenase/diacetyl reductase